jgi:drug/metabolite transporter (DMT)-like permease
LARKDGGTAAIDLPALGWAFLASLCSLEALLLMYFALQSKPASMAVAMTSAYPVVTLLLAIFTHAETFNLKNVLGIVLIVAGVMVMQL